MPKKKRSGRAKEARKHTKSHRHRALDHAKKHIARSTSTRSAASHRR